MFRKPARPLIAAALCLLVLSSCEKEDDPTRTEMLTSGRWQLTGAVANPPVTVGGISFSDVYTVMPACYKDNLYTFKTDGTAEVDEGAQKCDPASPQTLPVNWSLSANEQELTLAGNTLTILELTNNKLRVKGSVTVQNLSANAELTFSK